MTKIYNAPVSMAVYLGSGKTAEKFRLNIAKAARKENGSVSEYIVRLLIKADPKLMEGVEDAKSR